MEPSGQNAPAGQAVHTDTAPFATIPAAQDETTPALVTLDTVFEPKFAIYRFVPEASIATRRAAMPDGKESQLQLATPVAASIRQSLTPMAKKTLPLTGSTETPVAPWVAVPGP
jgi:hypothetical protein